MKKLITSIILLVLMQTMVFAQSSVSGQVTSEEDGTTLPGVAVKIKGTSKGVVTDIDGRYSIELTEGENTLVFSYVGMQTQEVAVDGRSTIDVELSTSAEELSEVVVVGYGTQKKADVTTSIASLDNENIENVPASYSFEGAMQGQMAGVNVTSSSATPGAAINVNVRGVTSIGASSQPLYVVDGIPMVSRNNSALNSNIQPINPMADINPNDIESITVLKDAASAAIYGSRGANGVILITTKKGEVGVTKFNVGYYTGISEVTNTPNLMSSKQWIEFLNVAAENDGFGENYWNSRIADPNDPDLKTYNAYDEIFRTGVTHNFDFNARGGNEKTRFYISGNYFDQEGIQLGLGFRRFSARLNLDHQVSDKVGIGASVMVSRTDHDRTINENDEYGVIVNSQAWDPTAPLRTPGGGYTNPLDYNGWWALENPLFIAEEYINEGITERILASSYVTYDILDNLTLKSTFSADVGSFREESFVPAGGNQTEIGEGVYATYNDMTLLNENTLTYRTTFADDHNVTVLGGFTLQESRADFSETSGTGFPSNSVPSVNTAANTEGSANATSYGFQSILGRVNYDFRGKYLFSASLRVDGSSRFGENNRYGTFPSFSAGWVLTEEEFLRDAFTTVRVSNLKLRGSYGSNGNAEIGNFLWRGVYNLTSPYNANGGTAPSVLENPDLSWETTTQLNVGLDLGMFNNRLSVTADYFVKDTEDLLLDADVPGSLGFSTVTSNFGQIQNKGYELSLGYDVLPQGDLSWNINANYTHVENEVIDVINDGQIISRNFVIQEGKPLSQLYLIKFLGVDPLNGDAVFEDVNGDGLIDLDDRQAVGSGMPTDFAGLTNTVSYKGLTLSVFLQYSGGNQIFNQSRHAYENYGSLRSGIPYGNQSTNALDYWREPGDITDIPRPSLAGPDDPDAQWQRFSTQYLEDGDFLRLKNVKLSYQLPTQLVDRVNLRSVEVYVQGRNLVTWTNYMGFDPEVSTNTSSQESLNTLQGEDFGTLGQARTYTFGINIGF